MYVEHPPPRRLHRSVRCLWRASWVGAKRVVPDGCMDLIIGDGTVFVTGPDTTAWLASPSSVPPVSRPANASGVTHGIRFQPGHAPRCLGVAADELRDQRVPLADLWGRRGAAITERLLRHPDQLADVVAGTVREPNDPALDLLVHRIEAGAPAVTSALRGMDIGERQLRRRFTAAVGYGPATYLRVARLQRAIAAAAYEPDLASLSAVAGYADQAHLSRECRNLTGLAPSAFFADRMPARADAS